MTLLHGYPFSELILVLVILESGIVANVLNSPGSFSVRKISSNMIHGVIAALVIVAYGVAQHVSIHHTIAIAGVAAITWPKALNLLIQLSKNQD